MKIQLPHLQRQANSSLKLQLAQLLTSALVLVLIFSLIRLYFPKDLKVQPAKANNISTSNISMTVNTTTKLATVTFTVTWDNSYNLVYDGQAFWDAAWIFGKYSTAAGADGSWQPMHFTTGGSVTPTSDGLGAFVSPGASQTIVWNYGGDGVTNGYANIKLGAIEMVYIPTGQYYYDVGGVGGSGYNNYGGGSQVLVSSATQLPTGAAANWPNGYSAFYIAKYEVSQGQYTDFLNSISSSQASNAYGTCGGYRDTIVYNSAASYGSRYSTTTPNRAANCISWSDNEAYDAWTGMRPMTEMEFEKAGRGTSVNQTNTNIYPWGSNDPDTSTYSFDGINVGQYYANWNLNGTSTNGPVDVGHYLSGDITRTNSQTGASPYGVADLSGNVWEQVINDAWTQLPANGNGTPAIPSSWPSATSGKGLRGGSWSSNNYDVTYLRLSDRGYAGNTYGGRGSDCGARPARTAN